MKKLEKSFRASIGNFFALSVCCVLFFDCSTAELSKSHHQPQFDAIVQQIEASVKQTVLLPCTVRNIGDKVVSWIKTEDLSILTSATYAFSTDTRFESVHRSDADFWGLRIRGVKRNDSGQYECQVNTDPKMSLAVYLHILEESPNASKAVIKSGREVIGHEGSTVSLTCDIATGKDPGKEDLQVRWFHDRRELTTTTTITEAISSAGKMSESVSWPWQRRKRQSGNERSSSSSIGGGSSGGVSVETDYRDGRIRSRLILAAVSAQQSGNYTCVHRFQAKPSDTIRLRIIDCNFPESYMQRDSAVSSALPSSHGLCVVIALMHGCFSLA